MSSSVQLAKGNSQDFVAVHSLIVELAVFEKEPTAVTNTPEKLEKDWTNQKFDFFVFKNQNKVIGFCLYYYRYSTWKGLCLYLEDLYIQPAYRSQGLGKLAFKELQRIAKNKHCHQINWQVLDWNKRAIDFYNELGATINTNWFNGVLKV